MDKFFTEVEEHSIVKATIVEKYFSVWSSILGSRVDKIGYIDLYSGPGVYSDGTESTPVRILKKCVSDEKLRKKITTIFNDANEECYKKLKYNIAQITGIDSLKFAPTVLNQKVDDKIAEQFESMNMIPCFSFIDPFGYAGLSRKLIKALVKDFGCDCIFFFNFNRINSALNNSKVRGHINAILGEEVADHLRETVKGMEPSDREEYIMNKFCEYFWIDKKFALPFKFISPSRDCTSHYLIFVSKNKLGYFIMKEIMAKESSQRIQGIASFSYIPTTNKQLDFLYLLNMPLNGLEEDLINTFSGKTLTMKKIFEIHSINRPFISRNYKTALLNLEAQNKIIAVPAVRKKGTFGDDVKVTFK